MPRKAGVASRGFCDHEARVRKRGVFRKVHFLETLENLEILETLENPQTVQDKEESDHFVENLEILEILVMTPFSVLDMKRYLPLFRCSFIYRA